MNETTQSKLRNLQIAKHKCPARVPLGTLVLLRRTRDHMDRHYAEPLDVATLAGHALMSTAHFSRQFKAAYGETPHAYLMTRRIERSMALLRAGVGVGVTEACMAVGCTSLGSFSASFTRLVGETPSSYRGRRHEDVEVLPSCISRILGRPMPRR